MTIQRLMLPELADKYSNQNGWTSKTKSENKNFFFFFLFYLAFVFIWNPRTETLLLFYFISLLLLFFFISERERMWHKYIDHPSASLLYITWRAIKGQLLCQPFYCVFILQVPSSPENLQTLGTAPTCMEYILFTIMIKPSEQIYHLNPFDPSNKTLITAKSFLIIIKTKTVKSMYM